MNKFAFSTSKITINNTDNIQALKNALRFGIDAIVTSPNYTNGEAQKAISFVFDEMDEFYKENTIIINKHHISQDFDKNLSISLERLKTDTIDRYLIEIDKIDEKELFDIFLDFELAKQDNKIDSYGVSSYDVLDYDKILHIANDVKKELKINKHSFSTIEFALNIIKNDIRDTIQWASKNDIKIITNKPLTVLDNGGFLRLVDYDMGYHYDTYLNELLELCDNALLNPLYNLILELDENKHRFRFVDDWNIFLFKEVLPHIKEFIEDLDEKNQQTLLNYIDIFLQEYTKMVKYECSKRTRDKFGDIFEYGKPMQECALDFIKKQDGIEYVALGMPKPSYVYDILGD